MTAGNQPVFIENPIAKSRPDNYLTVTVDTAKIVENWRISLFSYEWVLPDGRIKSLAELPEKEQPKRSAVEEQLNKKQPLEMPVLGIGLMENIEIGAGRATFLTLAAHGVKTIPVHIPKSNEDEFSAFLV